jgi:nicotinamidase-related amidase
MDKKSVYGLINRQDCVLIVIDVQEKLMPVINEKENVILNTSRLVKFCGLTGIPVIITEQQKLGSTLPVVREGIDALMGTIEKIHFNCFNNPDFSNKIAETGSKTLILTGVESHICVAQTAIAAIPNFGVHVISDAISSRSLANKMIALSRMRDAGAVISSTEMFMYEILVQAGTDEFKSVLPLVK